MSSTSGRAFHVACPYTGAAICHCQLGGPHTVSTPQSSQKYYQQAKQLWDLWKASGEVFRKDGGVDVLVPALYRREVTVCPDVDEELPSHEEAEKAVKIAERVAGEALHKVAKITGSDGVSPRAPKGLQGSPKSSKKNEKSVASLANEMSILDHEVKKLDEEQTTIEANRMSNEEQIEQKIREAEKKLAEIGRAKKGNSLAMQISNEATSSIDASQPTTSQAQSGALNENLLMSLNQRSGQQNNWATSSESPAAHRDPAASGSKRKSRTSTSQKHNLDHRLKLLKPVDLSAKLQGCLLKVYWPGDGLWYPGLVQRIDLQRGAAELLYETSETEEVNLLDLIKNGEVAWIDGDASWASEAPVLQPPTSTMSTTPVATKRKAMTMQSSSLTLDTFSESPDTRVVQRSPHQEGVGLTQASVHTENRATRSLGTISSVSREPEGSRAIPLRDILRFGSILIGKRVEVFLAKEGVWMKGQVIAANPRQQNLSVEFDMGPRLILDGMDGNLVRLI